MANVEAFVMTQHATDPEDWQYLCLNPDKNGIEMKRQGEYYELVFVKNKQKADYQGIFKNFPHLEEYSTHDLFSKHPTKPHHWKREGRTDDTIVLKNGWSINPIFHEHLIASHDAVQHCVLAGTGMNVPVVIIELHEKY